MMGPFLIALAVFLFIVAVKGKSYELLTALNPDLESKLNQEEQNLDQAFTNWAKTNIWDPLTTAIHSINPFNAANIPGGGGGKSGTSLYTVPIVDAQGGAGFITVDASSPAAAVNNAFQGGNTPTGPANLA